MYMFLHSPYRTLLLTTAIWYKYGTWHALWYRSFLTCLVFRKKDLYLIITQKLTFHEIRRISYGFHEIRQISYGFHEIRRISPWNPWNPVDFMKSMKSGRFHPWNLADFTQISPVKSTQNYKSKCFSKNSSVWWMQGGGFHPWNPPDFTLKNGGFHLWNLVDFTQISPMKSTQDYKSKCFSKNSSVWWMQGGGYDQGFHEIHQISPWKMVDFIHEIWQISPRFHLWNPPKIIKASVSAKTLQFDECRVGDFTLKSGRFHLWNLVDFTQISPVKSTQNYKSKCFSKNSSVWWMQGGGYDQGFHPWNLVDFTQISPVKSTQNYKSKCFSKNSSVWWMQGGGYDQGFHEIHQISPWNLADLTSEIQWISPRYHLWNPPKIIKTSVSAKTLQFDECRVGDFTLEIQWISPWNLVDFIHEIWQISLRFDLWNPPKIIKASVLAKTLQFDECRVGDFTLEIWWISPWNLVDSNHEIWWISPRFHLWNPPKIIKASVSAKTLQFDECRVGAMTKDFTCEIEQISPTFHLWHPPKIIKASVFSKNSSVWWMQGGGYDQGFHKIHQISREICMKSTGFQNYELLHDDQV